MSHLVKVLPRGLVALGLVVGLTGVSGIASAEGWTGVCEDPGVVPPASPYSTDYGVSGLRVESQLFNVTAGTSGTVAYGNIGQPTATPPIPPTCFVNHSLTLAGGWSFGIPVAGGSIQAQGVDSGLAMSMGWPFVPALPWSFFRLTSDGTIANSVLFGSGGYNVKFEGLSKRYFVLGQQNAIGGVNIYTECTTRIIGDAAQMTFKFQNLDATPGNVGILAGVSPAMRLQSVDPTTGRQTANIRTPLPLTGTVQGGFRPDNYIGFSVGEGTRPLRTEHKYTSDIAGFPSYFKFLFGQSTPYGLMINTQPDTTVYKDADASDMLIVANRNQILRDDEAMDFNLFGDFLGTATENDIRLGDNVTASDFGGMLSFLQRIPTKAVPPTGTSSIVMYFHLAHTSGTYFDPYTLVTDMPDTVTWGNSTGTAGYPANVTVGAWIDNQYADIEKEVTLSSVRMTITIPDNGGLKLAPGETRVKTIGTVAPNVMRKAQWNLVPDGAHPGNVPVSIQVDSFPGPSKTLTKTIRVAASSLYPLTSGANLLTIPFQLPDTSLASSFLSPNIDPATGNPVQLLPGRDFVAYTWDPQLRTYVPAQSVQRGVGLWFVPTTDLPSVTVKGAENPNDAELGGLIVGLRPGWNLIGNPYNYPIKLGELTGVDESDPQTNKTWDQLVRQSSVNGALNTWNAATGQYDSIAGNDTVMEPGKGYWIFVSSASPLRLVYPPLFTIGVSGITDRSKAAPVWKQSDRQWKLQLAASSLFGSDTNNFIGMTRDNKSLVNLNVMKPPMAPGTNLELSVVNPVAVNSETRMSQSFSTVTGKRDWKVNLTVQKAGDVTLTWPNLATVPRNVRFTLKDDVTGESKDLRAASGTTVNFAKPGTRSFTVSMVTSGSSRPVISNAIAIRSSREANAPVQISYTLSDSALVTVRVLSASGKEVYTATRGRADNAGDNTVTWALRDNANRAVAPGTYRVEILAETPSGDRVRRIVPVNVIR